MSSIETRMANNIALPKRGEVVTIATALTTKWLDLGQTVLPVAQPPGAPAVGVLSYFRGRYITIQATTQDVYVAFTNDTSTAIVAAGASTVNGAGLLAIATADCFKIPAGTSIRVLAPGKNDMFRYLAFVATAAGNMTVYASSSQLGTVLVFRPRKRRWWLSWAVAETYLLLINQGPRLLTAQNDHIIWAIGPGPTGGH